MILRLLRHSPKVTGYNISLAVTCRVRFRDLRLGGQTFGNSQFCNHLMVNTEKNVFNSYLLWYFIFFSILTYTFIKKIIQIFLCSIDSKSFYAAVTVEIKSRTIFKRLI